MIVGTYDTLVNLIANVQGFKKAETSIHRLNRALDALNKKLALTKTNMAALGAIPAGAASSIAGAAATGTRGGGGRRGGKNVGPLTAASVARGGMPVRGFFTMGGFRGNALSPGGLGLAGAGVFGIATYLGLSRQMEREKEQLVTWTLANQREREMFFPKGFSPEKTNWKMYGLTQKYGLDQSSMAEGFRIGKTYGIPFDKFLNNSDEFGKMMTGLSVYADNPERMRRAFLAMGQMWQTDRVEMRDTRQLMELGFPLQDILKEDYDIDLRSAIKAQDHMSAGEREEFRTFLMEVIMGHATGEDGRLTDVIADRRKKLFGAFDAITASGNQLWKSLGEGIDRGNQFARLLDDLNVHLQKAIMNSADLGDSMFQIIKVLNWGVGVLTDIIAWFTLKGWEVLNPTEKEMQERIQSIPQEHIREAMLEETGLNVTVESTVVDQTKGGIIVLGDRAYTSKFGFQDRHRKDGME